MLGRRRCEGCTCRQEKGRGSWGICEPACRRALEQRTQSEGFRFRIELLSSTGLSAFSSEVCAAAGPWRCVQRVMLIRELIFACKRQTSRLGEIELLRSRSMSTPSLGVTSCGTLVPVPLLGDGGALRGYFPVAGNDFMF